MHVMTSQEREFIEGLNQKSRKAYHLLYRQYYAMLVVYALRFLQSKEEAEDAVQDVFLALWEDDRKFENTDDLLAFLYTSLKNRCLNVLRERTSQKKYEAYYRSFNQEIANAEEPVNVTYEEVLGKLYHLIDQLPSRCRMVFLLYMDGRKNEEIAEALNITVNTVKAQKQKAMEKLKEQMGELFVVLVSVGVFG